VKPGALKGVTGVGTDRVSSTRKKVYAMSETTNHTGAVVPTSMSLPPRGATLPVLEEVGLL
jgi:hypothetical protein